LLCDFEDSSEDSILWIGTRFHIGEMRFTGQRHHSWINNGHHPPGVAGQRILATCQLTTEVGNLHVPVLQRSIENSNTVGVDVVIMLLTFK